MICWNYRIFNTLKKGRPGGYPLIRQILKTKHNKQKELFNFFTIE